LRDISFKITADRKIEILDQHIDTLVLSQFQKDEENDSDLIQFVQDKIQLKSMSVSELHEISKAEKFGYSRPEIENVLKRYSSANRSCPEPKWLAMKAQKYGTVYGMIAPDYAKKLKSDWGTQNNEMFNV
jgi:hypothetical protein